MVGTLGRYELSQGTSNQSPDHLSSDALLMIISILRWEHGKQNHLFLAGGPNHKKQSGWKGLQTEILNWETGPEEDPDLAARFHTGSIPSAGGVLDNSKPSASP
ncbi:hypothetical protein CIRG_08860 [Coccidioides immitis RMSCC 2394]|uniref:Uncharacterized protein n=1 Tax=Coccidioides immitis RMSCC 2394 TaxID=404692 RepID=A0A0J6YPP6_COCIT|nr:hypothetical protein CIRG_08860 [Coccidioides immitis RMSCC 2394]